MLLVGDSLGMVELGYDTTLPVTMHDILRHTCAVRAGAPHALIVADMPFLSHQLSIAQALRNAGTLLQTGGATAVKLEGGRESVETVRRMVSAGIPVMGHLGLQPQSVHVLGGFRQQARPPKNRSSFWTMPPLLKRRARLRSYWSASPTPCPRGNHSSAYPGDRHRFRSLLRWPGVGGARHFRIERTDGAALCQAIRRTGRTDRSRSKAIFRRRALG